MKERERNGGQVKRERVRASRISRDMGMLCFFPVNSCWLIYWFAYVKIPRDV